jgi:hypothetical protein
MVDKGASMVESKLELAALRAARSELVQLLHVAMREPAVNIKEELKIVWLVAPTSGDVLRKTRNK